MKKLVHAFRRAQRYLSNADDVAKALWEIRTEMAHQSRLLEAKLSESLEWQRAQTQMMAEFFKSYAQKNGLPHEAFHAPDIKSASFDAPDDYAAFQKPPVAGKPYEAQLAKLPLMLDEHTFNGFHPHYDPAKARNYSGRIFNPEKPCDNSFYREIRSRAEGSDVPDRVWKPILREMWAEVRSLPEFKQVAERKAFVENYIIDISEKYGAYYAPGWVSMDDALFLYWLVRKHNPKTIVQTGVCNGLSCSFIMMALDKNNAGGKLYAVDMPAVFNPNDPVWTVRDQAYGVVIPEGKSSGWIVPDAYRNRFEVISGDAKEHLPKLMDRLSDIDMFYHDSDHTYHHMMFEFRQAKRKLRRGGLMVADDIGWNASLWDFADEYAVPAYNYKKTIGVAFF